MEPKNEPPSFAALEEGIRGFKRKTGPRDNAGSAAPNAGFAMRMGMELVAGVLVGAGSGILLDRWLGTTPWLMIACFFLGAAGGGMNLYRLAQSQSMTGQSPEETNVVNENETGK